MASQAVRPAAAEVRSMLNKIRIENIDRCRNAAKTSEMCFHCCHARPILRSLASVNRAAMTSMEALCGSFQKASSGDALAHRAAAASLEMGSFTSQPKAVPAPDAESNDDDVHYQNTRVNLNLVLQMCSNELKTMPPPFNRKWMKVADQSGTNRQSSNASTGETIRLLQWNVLSQSLGTKNDNFVRCPDSALNWRTRRFRMLEEMVRFDPDIICLQEVDHFRFLRKSLASLGYVGHFLPKPDSPCLYLTDNSGPDGCALFYKEDKFDLCKIDHRILEVWRVQSNQVLMSAMLRSRSSHEEFVVATTHLKARNGAILSTLRNEQGKDLIDHLASFAAHRPVIIAGDFNAEPIEPVYMTMTNDSQLRLASAYAQAQVVGCEPKYTTWKIREDGEHIETLDYIFHSKDRFRLEQVLELPSGEDIGPNRLPSLAFASDHLSLACDLKLLPAK